MPKLTICFPVFNEVLYIDNLLKSIFSYQSKEREVIIIDGGSTDGTLEKVKLWQTKYPDLRLINNPKKIVSSGFNKAYKETSGKYITLMGAHAEYPASYFEIGLSYLEKNECDVVGGFLLQKGKSWKGKIIAACMSSRFGVGGTEFRTSKKKKYVDSVAFAIYKREIFEESGLLDEELVRNQDDEFHYRLNSAGFRILLVPEMQCTYFVRENIIALWRQYFQYGYYKPLVLQKVRTSIRLRHIVPSLFVLYLILLPLFLKLSITSIFPGLLYLLSLIISSIKTGKTIKEVIFAMLVFIVLHMSYGFGFIFGLNKIKIF